MKRIDPVPLTEVNFEQEYRISTGLNFITKQWIIDHKPVEYDKKVLYFVKLLRNIQPIKDHWVGNKFIKYGILRIFVINPKQTPDGPQSIDECELITDFSNFDDVKSGLVQFLESLIFNDDEELSYLTTDDQEIYILTSSGDKILITK